MLSTIQIISDGSLNKWDWGTSGLEFEQLVYDYIANEIRLAFSHGAELIKTPNTRDGGVDLIIKTTVPITLMGQKFSMCGKDMITIHIECKYTSHKTLALEKFSKNLLIATTKKIDYFLLVTNASISPYSFYQAVNNFSHNTTCFRYIDQDTLLMYLEGKPGTVIPIIKEIPKLFIAYQTEKRYINGQLGLDLYIMFKNNTPKTSSCSLQLLSDRNWELDENIIEIVLDQAETVCRKISVEKINYDGGDDILLQFLLDGERKTVQITGTSMRYNFVLPFSGEEHKKLYQEILQQVTDNEHIHTLCLVGEAGIGKTRIIDEAYNTLLLRGNTCFRFTYTRETSFSNLCSILRKQFKLSSSNRDSLIDIAQSLSTNVYKRYFIVIEDIHNAPDLFFQEIQDLEKANITGSPVYFVVAGRNDGTVCNDSYYAFLDWCKHREGTEYLRYRKVTHLKKQECINLIRLVINDAPSFVIEKIEAFSRGNPFYLIQYIEYLLETQIIYLVNRNTVGITNASTFSGNLYMPAKIEELLEERFEIISKQQPPNVMHFLYALAYMGCSAQIEFQNYYWGDSNPQELQSLYQNHILKLTNQGVCFDHESIYLFLKEKIKKGKLKEMCCKTLSSNSAIFSLLPPLKKGEVLLYVDDIDSAKDYLKTPIIELLNITNISSINLTPEYYEYYFSLYNFSNKIGLDNLDKKALIGIVYNAMHNLSSGSVSLAFQFVNTQIQKKYKDDVNLTTSIAVLYAHYYLSAGQMSKAKQYITELLALERYSPELFDDQTRFNLFDRASSLYLQENHIEPAQKYNRMSLNIAEKLGDYKLLTLAKIIEAKISFYTNVDHALSLMKEAQELLCRESAVRINCHNSIGMLTAKILISGPNLETCNKYIPDAVNLLNEALQIGYPLAIIRTHYLLSVLYYLSGEITLAKQHLDNGIETSIRIGNIKLLPHFYNMKLIIAAKEDQPITVLKRYAETSIEYLKQLNMLFLGALNFGSSNIINITNHAIFLKEYMPETESYKFMRTIEFYGFNHNCDFDCSSHKECRYSCYKNREIYLDNYKRIEQGNLLFMDKKSKYNFRDSNTPFYIPLGV